jgi:hypothetical protein
MAGAADRGAGGRFQMRQSEVEHPQELERIARSACSAAVPMARPLASVWHLPPQGSAPTLSLRVCGERSATASCLHISTWGCQTTVEPQARGQSQRQVPSGVYRHLPALALGGAVAFWATTFATSLTPIAADYRAAFSIAWLPMVLVESSLAGLVIGSLVSYFLISLYDRIPVQGPILKAEILSVMALVIGVLVAWVGASRLEPNEAVHAFLVGALLNVPRFLVLGLAIGHLYERLYVSAPADRKG